jgi:hypothetical protein
MRTAIAKQKRKSEIRNPTALLPRFGQFETNPEPEISMTETLALARVLVSNSGF